MVVEREESGVGGEKSDRREYEKYLVLRVHDNIMFFIWFNSQNQLSYGGQQFPFPMLNPTGLLIWWQSWGDTHRPHVSS